MPLVLIYLKAWPLPTSTKPKFRASKRLARTILASLLCNLKGRDKLA